MNTRVILYAMAFVCMYFLVLRPVRVLLIQEVILPLITTIKSDESPFIIYTEGQQSFFVFTEEMIRERDEKYLRLGVYGRTEDYTSKPFIDDYPFTGFGTIFFLLGGIFFLLSGYGWIPVIWLFVLHLSISLFSFVSLSLAVVVNYNWIYLMKLLVTYITPAATGMFVLETVSRKRKSMSDLLPQIRVVVK